MELSGVFCYYGGSETSQARAMPHYRLYRLNPVTDRIAGVETFNSTDDVEAVCLVHQRVLDVPMELWRGSDKLARYDADRAAQEPPPMRTQGRASL
jgi:hypothetical protein